MIRKNKTEFSSRLDLSKSLNSVMIVKMSLQSRSNPATVGSLKRSYWKNVNLDAKNAIVLIQARTLNK